MKYPNYFTELDKRIYTKDELKRMERINWYNQSMRLRESEASELRFRMFDIDIRVLTYLYLCANPDITQGEFARKIGSNPVALSRAINTERFVIKEDWINDIANVLATMDTETLSEKIKTLLELQSEIKISKRREYAADIIAKHYGFTEFDELTGLGTYWTIFLRLGGFIFTDAETATEWIFWDHDTANDQPNAFSDDPFALAELYLSASPDSKVSVFTSDIRQYENLVKKYLQQKRDNEQNRYRSIILIDTTNMQFLREQTLP